jgi:hypothetical protein
LYSMASRRAPKGPHHSFARRGIPDCARGISYSAIDGPFGAPAFTNALS